MKPPPPFLRSNGRGDDMQKLYFIAVAVFLVSGIVQIMYDRNPLFYLSSFILAGLFFVSGMMERQKKGSRE
ncbi:preprotein translocase subunit SecG [Alkalihalobacillus xiaoxiensis]|uniref:Preprotein translocase subunit SecG n=1 Tax=Shouchella xiaoxiensis TaxID=766895 RepID=A0ABS2SQU6_9BACI|nr:hypothetical protein [Shouchella xiaoxiensis]MBM7837865.1 preprotein translocase subunit SecG [Shouchella xiaoxiensis]